MRYGRPVDTTWMGKLVPRPQGQSEHRQEVRSRGFVERILQGRASLVHHRAVEGTFPATPDFDLSLANDEDPVPFVSSLDHLSWAAAAAPIIG